MAALRNRKMGSILVEKFNINFVFDEWDIENDTPKPNRLKNYVHQDDGSANDAWVLSVYPMAVFDGVVINPRKLQDVIDNPNEMFYYHVWHRNSLLHRFFSNDTLPVDNDILHLIRTTNNFHLILMNECEFEEKRALEYLDRILKKEKIDPKKVWFINNNEKLLEYKNELNVDFNVHTSRSMSVSMRASTRVNFKEDKEGPFFLCHNRSPRTHRYALLTLLMKEKLLDTDINWSLIGGWSFNNVSSFKDIFNIDDVLNNVHELSKLLSIDIKKSNYETQYTELDDRVYQRLPVEPNTYENSYFNITTETNFVSEDIHITEKSFKAFFYYQFPIFVASYNHLKYFRNAYPEFDFFDDVIDHSYDEIRDNRHRLLKIVELIKGINSNKEFFIKFYKNNKDRFVKNFNILANFFNKYDYDFFKGLSEVSPGSDDDFLHVVYDNWDYDLQKPIDMNCKEIYTDSFLMPLDSFLMSHNFPEELIKRYPISDVVKYPNKTFYYFITLTPNQISDKIRDYKLPMPQEVIDLWKSNKNFNVVVANEQEWESFKCFRTLHLWTQFNNLNQTQLYMANNNIRMNDYKNELKSGINVHSTSKVRSHIALPMISAMPDLSYTTDKPFIFLCHNRRVRPHRYALLCLLKKEGILDSMDWSLSNGWDSMHRDIPSFYTHVLSDDTIAGLSDEIQYFHSIEQKKSFFEEDKDWFRMDNVNNVNWGETYETKTYISSYFNIVTETEFDNTEIHISEKSFKPFVAFQFPLILASPHHIREIKKYYSFDFFDDVIDHSYDSIEDHKERLLAFVSEIKRIYDNKDFFIEFYKNNKDRFIKNHEYSLEITKDTTDRDWLKNLRYRKNEIKKII